MKKIVILGAGESGTGAALLAKAKGFEVFVSDIGNIASPYREELIKHNIAFEEGKHSHGTILAADEIVKSPGIPDNIPIIRAIHKAKLPIIAEVELASRYAQAFLIGVTGTNGKTTTTHLIYHLLKVAGYRVAMAGNIGTSFSRKVLERKQDYYVLELSNFQLEGMYTCKLDVACLLNITPDHLDRYQDKMEPYVQAKFRILQNMTAREHFIYNQDDVNIKTYLQQHTALPRQHPVSTQQSNTANGNHSSLFENSKFSFLGPHNLLNALVATRVVQLLDVGANEIQTGLLTFPGIPHRIEQVTEIGGITFYNDSKATNVAATQAALLSFAQPIIWIAGGQDKGNDYTALQILAKTHVKAIICLGKDNKKICQAFQGIVTPIYTTTQMSEAVALALHEAQPKDIVLFSPACASFDLFKNFEERGACFKKAVLQNKITQQANHSLAQ